MQLCHFDHRKVDVKQIHLWWWKVFFSFEFLDDEMFQFCYKSFIL